MGVSPTFLKTVKKSDGFWLNTNWLTWVGAVKFQARILTKKEQTFKVRTFSLCECTSQFVLADFRCHFRGRAPSCNLVAILVAQ
jgi:hypothetical protein